MGMSFSLPDPLQLKLNDLLPELERMAKENGILMKEIETESEEAARQEAVVAKEEAEAMEVAGRWAWLSLSLSLFLSLSLSLSLFVAWESICSERHVVLCPQCASHQG